MRRLLIVSYHFPPDSAIGAVRPAKFAKYLPEFGWEPVVLTVKEDCYERCDHAGTDHLPERMKIFRYPVIPGPLHLYSKIRARRGTDMPDCSKTTGADRAMRAGRPTPVKRFLSALLRLPDDRQGWAATVAWAGSRIMRKCGIVDFMTSGPPMSTHLGGLVLKKLTGARWIADFRDPWVTTSRWKEPALRSPACDRIEEGLEQAVLKSADVVLSTAPGLTRYFRSKLHQPEGGKCATITNGFDETDFDDLETFRRNGKSGVTLRHAGSLYLGRDPEPFFRALKNLMDRNVIQPGSLCVEFIGDGMYNNIPLSVLISKHGVEATVKLVPRMDFKACLERLAAADALLLFAQGFAEQIPAKVFEYLRINRPVFAVVDGGDVLETLAPFPNCFIADPRRIDLMEEALVRMIRAIVKNAVMRAPDEIIRQYDRRRLTARLASLLDDGRMGLRAEGQRS